jgi:hypothetical protein
MAERRTLNLSNGILIHSGGWKKLEASAVTAAAFRDRFGAATGLRRIFNFYGMVEQIGTVFLEADDNLLYPPSFADVIIRDPRTLAPLPPGETGLIEVLSLLPRSYPGHAILTEDLGSVRRVDNPTAQRGGKGIVVTGRLPRAQLRGCSDTYVAAGRTDGAGR